MKSNDKKNHSRFNRKSIVHNSINRYAWRSNNAINNVLSVANNSISNLPKGVLVESIYNS